MAPPLTVERPRDGAVRARAVDHVIGSRQSGAEAAAGVATPMAAPQHVGSPPPARPVTPAGPPPRAGADNARRTKAPRRPPRLASLQLKRVDPWTVLKISLIVAIVMFFVWMIAIGILYLTLGSMDVWGKINDTFSTLTSAPDAAAAGQTDLITPARVFVVTAIIGAINIVLFTALATVAAFIYNAAAAMSGGVELTLGERD